MIIKFILIFTLLSNEGITTSGVAQQTIDDLDSCKAAEVQVEKYILENIQAGKLKNGFAQCKLIKVKLPGKEV